MKRIFFLIVFVSMSILSFSLSKKDNVQDSIFYTESISYIITNISQDHPEKYDTLCNIILSQHNGIKNVFGVSSTEYNTLIQAADFIYTLSHIPGFKPLQKDKELGRWIRQTEKYYDSSTYCQLSIATALSDYYNTNKRWKKAKYWIDIQKELSEQSENFYQLGNAYVAEASVATSKKDKELLHNVINGVLSEKRIPQQVATIALNQCLLFGYEQFGKKEIESIYTIIASKDSLDLQNLLCVADKAAEHNDTIGVNIILESQSVSSLTSEEYIHLYHEVSSFFRENNPNKAIALLKAAILYGQNHQRNDLLFEEWDHTYHYYRTIALHYISQLNDRKSYIEYELKNLDEIKSFYGQYSKEYCKTVTDFANIMSVYGHSPELTMKYDSISVDSHLRLYGNSSTEYIQSVLNQMGHAKQHSKFEYFWNCCNRIESLIVNCSDSIQCTYYNLLGQVYTKQGEYGHAIRMFNNALQKNNSYNEKCNITNNLASLYKNEGNNEMAQECLKALIDHSGFKNLSNHRKFLILENYADCLTNANEKYSVYIKSENLISDNGISIYNKVQHYLNKSRNSPTRIAKLEALKKAKNICFSEQIKDSTLYVQVLSEIGAEYNSYCNTKKAVECYEEVYKILSSRDIFDTEYQKQYTQYFLRKLTGLYAAQGNIEKSQSYAEQWLEFAIEACNNQKKYSTEWLYGVTHYLSVKKATMLFEKYDEILKRHPYYLWGKAYLSERKGLFLQAINLYEECLEDTSLLMLTLPRLLKMYKKTGNFDKISQFENQYVKLQSNSLLSQLIGLTESEQKNMIPLIEGSIVQTLQGMPNLHTSYSAFNYILFCKGLLYNFNSIRRDLLSKRNYLFLQNSLRLTREELAIFKVKKDSAQIQMIQVKKDSLERMLPSNNKQLKLTQSNLQKRASSLELQNRINADELIIDIEKFNEDGNIYYKSIVMSKDIPPTIVDLYKEGNDTIFYNYLEPYIRRYKKVFLSPSGHSLISPLEHILRKKYQNIEFHRVFSLSDIHVDYTINEFNAVAFGNPSFNTEALHSKSLRSDMWQPLPGSKIEIDSITSYIRSNTTGHILQFTEENATESKLKTIDKSNINILHISTHGYFNPLTNESGLLFTGANRGLNGDTSDNVDDGVLTCDEIENLYFPNLKLVVLSACETGLGETNIDGVWGLQRAFRIAGAKNMIVSLKKVDDDLTQTFMISFYKHLASGKSIYNSFWEAMDKADEDTRNSFILIE